MSNELISVTNSWLSLAIPHLGPIADTIGFVQSLSDKLLFDKLYYVLSRQDSDFEEWLKISEKFEADNKDYNKNGSAIDLLYQCDKRSRSTSSLCKPFACI